MGGGSEEVERFVFVHPSLSMPFVCVCVFAEYMLLSTPLSSVRGESGTHTHVVLVPVLHLGG